jgi:hypothetical protein
MSSREDHSTVTGNYKTDLTLTGLLMEGLDSPFFAPQAVSSFKNGNSVDTRMFRHEWNRAFGMGFLTDLVIAGLQGAGQARIVAAVQPFELLLRPT